MKHIVLFTLIMMSLLFTSGTIREVKPEVEIVVEEIPVCSIEQTPQKEEQFPPPTRVAVEVISQTKPPKSEKIYKANEADVIALAKTAYGEYFLTDTPEHKMQCAAVMWCCCWHSVKGAKAGFADTVAECCAYPYHFLGFNKDNPVTSELREMAEDVLIRFYRYMDGESLEEVGCVLPPEYVFFVGNGKVNIFRDQYVGGNIWDWSLPNPYLKGE